MNFYRHHLGDYDGATAHLSWDEDMAYTRLLRAYYRREKPIPRAEVYRLVRAVSRSQRAAVDSVLAEFFTQFEDGWHNKRADEEIASFKEEGGEHEAKKEHERERQKRYRQRRKQVFAELREHGFIPKWDTPIEQLETQLNALQARNGHAPVTRTATANHKPEPEPEPEPEETPPTPSGGFLRFWGIWPPGERKQAQGKCWEVWRKKGFEKSAALILAHVESLKASNGWRDGFVCAPLVYLNQRRWEGAEGVEAPRREPGLRGLVQ